MATLILNHNPSSSPHSDYVLEFGFSSCIIPAVIENLL
ncbi:unnamed protein product, partial [Rotaria magnacalcarata]